MENGHSFAPQTDQEHAEFQHHVLTSAWFSLLYLTSRMPFIIWSKQHARVTHVHVLLQFLNYCIAGNRQVLEYYRLQLHPTQQKLKLLPGLNVVPVDDEDL